MATKYIMNVNYFSMIYHWLGFFRYVITYSKEISLQNLSVFFSLIQVFASVISITCFNPMWARAWIPARLQVFVFIFSLSDLFNLKLCERLYFSILYMSLGKFDTCQSHRFFAITLLRTIYKHSETATRSFL